MTEYCPKCKEKLNMRIKGFPPGTLRFKCKTCNKFYEWGMVELDPSSLDSFDEMEYLLPS